jgi:hypothetical protein
VNRLKIKVVMVAAVLGMSLAPQLCEAALPAEQDLRVGSFEGNWCGLAARFDITRKFGNTWKFEGKILIRATGQYDKITIEQLADNHLHMVRFLSGSHAGETQVTVTHPPETLFLGGVRQVNFPARRTEGFGAKLAGFLHMPAR